MSREAATASLGRRLIMDYIPLYPQQMLPPLRPRPQEPQAPHPGVLPETHQPTHPNSGPMGLARDHPSATPSPLTMRPEEQEMALQEPDPLLLTPPPLRRLPNTMATSCPALPLFNPNPFNGSAATDGNPVPGSNQLLSQASTAVPAAAHLHAGATSASGTLGAALPNQPAQPTSSMPPSMPQDVRPSSHALGSFSEELRYIQQLAAGAYSADDNQDDGDDPLGTGTGTISVTVNHHSNPANAGDWQGNGQGYVVSARASIARSTAAHAAGTGAVYPSTDARQASYHNLRPGDIAPVPDFPWASPPLPPPHPLITAQFAEPMQPEPVAQPQPMQSMPPSMAQFEQIVQLMPDFPLPPPPPHHLMTAQFAEPVQPATVAQPQPTHSMPPSMAQSEQTAQPVPDFPWASPPPPPPHPLITAQFAEPVEPVTVPVAEPQPQFAEPVQPVPIAVAMAEPMPVARPLPRVITMVDGRLQKVIRPPPGFEDRGSVTEPLEPMVPLQTQQQMMMMLQGGTSSPLASVLEPDGLPMNTSSQPETAPLEPMVPLQSQQQMMMMLHGGASSPLVSVFEPDGLENEPMDISSQPETEPFEPVFPLQSLQQIMMLVGGASSPLASAFGPDWWLEDEPMNTFFQPEPVPELEAVPDLEPDDSDQQDADTDSEWSFVYSFV